METFINFINHLSELSLFSYLLVDKESEIIYGEKNLTDIKLKGRRYQTYQTTKKFNL